jgi:SAM-dependent MidA family methyltransferase
MPFEEYMSACLYDSEDGFFATGPLRSTKAGDFLTSPEVSPWFGCCLGRFVVREHQRLGEPVPFLVVDVGAGSGSLLTGVRQAAGSSDFDYWAADASPAARSHLELLEGDGHTVVADLEEIPDATDGVVIANELLDNLPVAIVVRDGDEWEERWVDVGHGDDDLPFALVEEPARPDVAEWADTFAGQVPDGGLVEVQLAAFAWLRAALDRLNRGAVVIIDYGGTAEELEPRRTRGTLRTYRAHHLGPDPLAEPGETDVTVDVNFTALLSAAAEAGADAKLMRQDDFLAELGLRDDLSRIRREELEEARSGDAMRRLVLRSERTDAETLLHPRGLGDFRVLVATKR